MIADSEVEGLRRGCRSPNHRLGLARSPSSSSSCDLVFTILSTGRRWTPPSRSSWSRICSRRRRRVVPTRSTSRSGREVRDLAAAVQARPPCCETWSGSCARVGEDPDPRRDFTAMSEDERSSIRRKMGTRSRVRPGSVRFHRRERRPALREHTKVEESTIDIMTRIKPSSSV